MEGATFAKARQFLANVIPENSQKTNSEYKCMEFHAFPSKIPSAVFFQQHCFSPSNEPKFKKQGNQHTLENEGKTAV